MRQALRGRSGFYVSYRCLVSLVFVALLLEVGRYLEVVADHFVARGGARIAPIRRAALTKVLAAVLTHETWSTEEHTRKVEAIQVRTPAEGGDGKKCRREKEA